MIEDHVIPVLLTSDKCPCVSEVKLVSGVFVYKLFALGFDGKYGAGCSHSYEVWIVIDKAIDAEFALLAFINTVPPEYAV